MAKPTRGHLLRTRQKIRTMQLINRLHDHAFGKIELTVSQVNSIRILLNKSLPDLKALEISHGDDTNIKTITNSQLLSIIEGSAERVDDKAASG